MFRERHTGFGRHDVGLKLANGLQPPAHCMAPEPHTPSAEQHGLDDGHWDVALHVIRVDWAASPSPEPLLEVGVRLESISHAPSIAQASRDINFGRTRVMVADIFAVRMVLRVSCGKEWISVRSERV
jgi:hypothetical protein